MPLDHAGYDGIVETGAPLGQNAPCGPGRYGRRGIGMKDAVSVFGDPERAARWLERTRWGDGPAICPRCGGDRTSATARSDAPYWCSSCRNQFSLKTDTPMGGSRLSLGDWLLATYFDLTNLKGVSSMKLSRDLQIRQSSAWYMLQRIHEAFMDDGPPEEFAEGGEYQVDEAYIGGLEKNKHSQDRIPGSQGGATKMTVICVTHVNSGKVWADVITDTRSKTIADLVHRLVPEGGVVYTDDASHYGQVRRERHAVSHKAGEYTRMTDLAGGTGGMATTNHTESAWSMLKRSYVGVHHKMSPKHLRRYVKTFAGRWNIRSLDTEEQMRHVIRSMLRRPITYRELTADNGLPSGSGTDGAYFPERRKRYAESR